MTKSAEGFRTWSLQKALPADILVEGDMFHGKFSIAPPAAGTIEGHFGSLNGFLWSEVSVQTANGFSGTCAGCGRTIRMVFQLAGKVDYRGESRFSIAGGQHNIGFAPAYEAEVTVEPEKGTAQNFTISLPVAYYTGLLTSYASMQPKFMQTVADDQAGWLQEYFMPMTMPMKWIIHAMRQNQRTGLFRQLYMEAKTLELLMLQLEQVEVRGKPAVNRSQQREALQEARTILEHHYDRPPTIRTLARMVGLNEFSLKKGFRDAFQETIYGYVNRLKMQQARQMLLEGTRSVHEVSALAGYKNPQHFTTAFKKYFGVLPSQVRP